MKYSNIPVAQSIVLLCLSKGIDHVVLSPGSRNAPLTIGFAHHPEVKTYSIVDERSAAFFALGLAQQLQRPVAVCCTSGSALLNYYPAVAEAFYSNIPLIVLSADRPIERIDIGDGQTIRQRNVFENHILYSANLYSEVVLEQRATDPKLLQKQREATKHNEQEINKALNAAIEHQGPVHINIPFYEPLYNTTETLLVDPIIVEPHLRHPDLRVKELEPFGTIWNAARKKIVLIGVLAPGSLPQEYLDALGNDPSVLVFTETTSNVSHPNFFTRIDNLIGSLDAKGFEELRPELLVTFGGMIISKKIKAFLRDHQPRQHWHIDEKTAYDTYFCLNMHFECSPAYFWGHFLPLTREVASTYLNHWLVLREYRDARHEEYLNTMQWCDFKAFEVLLKTIPRAVMLQLGNSSTVRYVQLFDLDRSLKVYCNRGTSGIDGCTSTAVGAAVAFEGQTLCITGDLGFLYDSNGLWNNYIPQNFKIIVINNQGGGIFRILPGNKDSEEFETYFETVHTLNAQHLCAMHRLHYLQASDQDGLNFALSEMYSHNDKPVLLEIFTPRKMNDQVLLDYFKFIR